MDLFTIGFTKKSAEQFFELLTRAGIRRVVDVRLNNRSQLAGFAKRDDLRYFLQKHGGIDYEHAELLAPTQPILDAFKKEKGSWESYDKAFLALMAEREIEREFEPSLFDQGCLLCSEHKPHHCHRRLVAEYLQRMWSSVDIRVEHLVT